MRDHAGTTASAAVRILLVVLFTAAAVAVALVSREAAVPAAASSLGLDPSGRTIPDTNYPVPAGAIFMAPNGNDANAGTQAAPVRTINRAMALVAASGTIVLRAGVYRDWLRNSGGTGHSIGTKGVTIQNYPHEQVWFDGTNVIPAAQWVNAGNGRWYKDWSTPQFCIGRYYEYPPTAQNPDNSGPCSHKDMSSSPQAPIAGDPQMAFVNGVQLAQKPTLAEITATSFFYDWTARRLYIATDPAGKTVELAARPVAMVLGGSNPNGNTVRGIGFRRYASNEYHNLTVGALYFGGTGPNKVENTVFTENAAGALNFSNPRVGSYVKSSVFARNGSTPMGANGGSSSGTRNDFVIERNHFNGNNTELFGYGCTASCGQSSIKMAHMNGFGFWNNIVENGAGKANGFWCDGDCRDGIMVRNLIRNNGGKGIFYEISSKGMIASNLVTGNGGPGIAVVSAATVVYNNTLVDNQFGIWIYDDRRYPGPTGVPLNTTDIEVVNNIVWDEPHYLVKTSGPDADPEHNTTPSQFYDLLDYNAYYRVNGAGQFLHAWGETTGDVYYKSLAAFTTAKGWDSHSLDISSGTDPFFVNKAAGDYRVRTNSPAYNTGKALPAAVAFALGLPAVSPVSRGAISYPTP